MAHAYYRQPGGEDRSFETERDLLRDEGIKVITYTAENEELVDLSPPLAAARTVWNRRAHREIAQLVEKERPEVVHFQNTFPSLSPSVYYAARGRGAAVVQTLRNYRLWCLNGMFYRDGDTCELCRGRTVAWPGVAYACYRSSRPASAVTATMLSAHRALGTWDDAVDRYIVLTEFARRRLRGAVPDGRMMVKPNCVHPDPGPGEGAGGFALYAGRLSPEKGITTMLDAWRDHHPGLPLKIAGDGPLRTDVENAAQAGDVEYLGHLPHVQLMEVIQDAAVQIFPSEVYEAFPRSIVEAFACMTPVIAADLGSAREIVDEGETGLLFHAGDPMDLAAKVRQFVGDEDIAALRRAARERFETHYSGEKNVARLLEIYDAAVVAR